VFLEGVASRSPHGVPCVTKFLQIILICEDTYPRRDKWNTYSRRNKCSWAYNPTSHVESTQGHVKGVDP
jgi:hypothetical protein